MVEVISFDSHDDMYAYLSRAAAEADQSLHISQRALTWGDCWVRFVDIDNRIVEFGRIFTPDEVRKAETDAGATHEEAAAVALATARDLHNGMMYGRAHSFLSLDGEDGLTHKAHVWPIPAETFEAAQEAGWDIDRLNVEQKMVLQLAYSRLRNHAMGVQS